MKGCAKVVLVLTFLCLANQSALSKGKRDPFFIPRPDFYAPQTPESEDPEGDARPPNLIRQIGGDFKNVFTTKENVVVIGVGLAAAWGASYFDQRIVDSRFIADS